MKGAPREDGIVAVHPEPAPAVGWRRWTGGPRAAAISLGLVSAAFVHAVSTGWMRWGDWVIDSGRELEWPRRILEGERLYSDLRWYYGPLAPYANALLYRLFGVRAEVLAVAGIASAALMAAALWLLTRRLAGVAAATAVALAFTYACAFPHLNADSGIFNFALPYAFAATYGIVSATWSLLFLVVYAETERFAALVASLALLAVAALAKLEPVLPIAAAHAVMLLAAGRPRRRTAIAYLVAVLAIAAAYAALALHFGPAALLGGVTNQMNERYAFFARSGMGIDQPGRSLVDLARAWALLAAGLGASVAASLWARARDRRPVRAAAIAISGAAGAGVAWAGGPDLVFAAAPPLALAGSVLYAAKLLRRSSRRRPAVTRLLLWIFALACLPRIVLRPTVVGYGFYLLAPFLVPLAVLLFRDLPRRLHRLRWPRRAVAAFGAGALLGTAFTAMRISAAHYAERSTVIASSRGSMWVKDPVAASVVSFIQGLPAEARVLVLPEGVPLNFFGERRGADHMFSYLPIEFSHGEESELLSRWNASPPALIVMVGRSLGDFGGGTFGVDYARRCGEWIERRYRPLPGPFVSQGVLLAVPR